MGGAKTTSEKHRSLALRSRSIRRRSSLRACRGGNHNAADHQRRQNNVHPGRVQMQCGGQRHPLRSALLGTGSSTYPNPILFICTAPWKTAHRPVHPARPVTWIYAGSTSAVAFPLPLCEAELCPLGSARSYRIRPAGAKRASGAGFPAAGASFREHDPHAPP